MAGDSANDVGALNQTHLSIERLKKVYETQLKMSQRFNQPPPPVPPTLAAACPELVEVYA